MLWDVPSHLKMPSLLVVGYVFANVLLRIRVKMGSTQETEKVLLPVSEWTLRVSAPKADICDTGVFCRFWMFRIKPLLKNTKTSEMLRAWQFF